MRTKSNFKRRYLLEAKKVGNVLYIRWKVTTRNLTTIRGIAKYLVNPHSWGLTTSHQSVIRVLYIPAQERTEHQKEYY